MGIKNEEAWTDEEWEEYMEEMIDVLICEFWEG